MTRRQLITLVALTLVWGVNWPILKIGATGFPPLSFRALSLWPGLVVLALVMLALKVPFRIPRKHWPEVAKLTVTNMLVWHVCIMLAVKSLSSGRTAILGYTMPIFSAVMGALLFGVVLIPRAWLGVGSAALGVTLLLWNEFSSLAGHPGAVALALFAAAVWALGTRQLQHSNAELPTLTLTFWMLVPTAVVLALLGAIFERGQWQMPNAPVWWAAGYNAVMIFGFAQGAWFYLARTLPPVASTISVMLIPVLGVFSGAVWLGEVLHWQDWAAVALMVAAIALVLWPTGSPRAPEPA